ncbi:protein sax-3-like [Megalops cyprinoides]|uniref:protein sax-3-like n=1 Tax=Megalops cyprinoides TaxID=118141 RepID=UPI001864DDAA|nr:protein sax-3-like [Megalops cyprinoides]
MVNTAKASLFFQILLFSCATTPIVWLSVPEGHYIILICSGHTHRNTTFLEWRGADGDVIAIKRGHSATTMRDHKYSLLSDGSLLIKSLHRTDSGEYRCREQVVADVEVLTGQDYNVTAGRTVLLPCKVTDKHRQKWVLKRNKERKPIYTRHKNGTVRKEIEDPQNRFSHMEDNTLQIADLQPEDTGEYWCNGRRAASLTVRTDHPCLHTVQSALFNVAAV